ncbi:MAG: ABC transporter ATP-binding protein [Flavobacteriales bacterium]|nr:ABC transporter ATP-binding protein [Flavobacteriales bacterium]
MNAISVKKVSKEFSGHLALNKVSLSVPQKKIFGLLGPNGAGKTTLIRIINQITAPDSGTVSFFKEPLAPEHVHQIGYLPEERGLYRKMKVGEQAMYLAQLKGLSAKEARQRLDEWFDRFEITAWWDKKVEELSKGMAQKIQFITTVVHDPKLLILDEPFSGFDPINVELVRSEMQRLRKAGATIMLSTHNMGSVEELCDSIALINQSEVILQGKVDQIKSDFDQNTYEITFKGNVIAFTNALWTNYELIEKQSTDDLHICKVKFVNQSSLNHLLNAVLSEVEILEVKKLKPTMHEIFIEAVRRDSQKKEELA